MPKLPSILNRLAHHDLPQLTRRFLRLHALRMMFMAGINIRLGEAGMQQAYHDSFLFQVHGHALAYTIHGRLTRPIRVCPTRTVVANAANAAAHYPDY